MTALAADPEWMDLAATAGHAVAPLPGLTQRELRRTAAIVIGPERAWERIRGWRATGVAVGIVVIGAEAPTDDRPGLEPVVALPRADAPALADALRRLAVEEAPARVPLASGVADFHRHVFERADGKVVRLTALEARLLAYLAARSFRAVSREELQEQVWGYARALPTRTVETTINRLRKKIAAEALLTVRGEGYRVVRLGSAAEEPSTLLPTLREAVWTLAQRGQPEAAGALLERFESERDPDDARSRAEALQLRARLAQDRREWSLAVRLGRAAMALADEHGWPRLLADVTCMTAAAERISGRGPEALALATRAEALFRAVSDPIGTARSLAIRSDLVDPAASIELAEQALRALEGADEALSAPLRANFRSRIGTSLRRLGRLAESIAAYEAAAAAYLVLGRIPNVVQLRTGTASLRGRLGDDAGARTDLTWALAHAPPELLPIVQSAAAVEWAQSGSPAEGARLADDAVRALGDRRRRPEHALCVAGAAFAYVLAGRRGDARALLPDIDPSPGAQHELPQLLAWLHAALADPPDLAALPADHRSAVALRRALGG